MIIFFETKEKWVVCIFLCKRVYKRGYVFKCIVCTAQQGSHTYAHMSFACVAFALEPCTITLKTQKECVKQKIAKKMQQKRDEEKIQARATHATQHLIFVKARRRSTCIKRERAKRLRIWLNIVYCP